jgi:hypothetical protein
MSIATTTTLAAARDVAAPKQKDIGKTRKADDAEKTPTLFDLLVTLVPTEVVVPYTLVTTGIVALIDEPTAENPNPPDYALWRWIAFGFLVFGVVALVLRGKRRKSTRDRFPRGELTGSLVAGVAFGLAIPDSPLYTHYSNGEAGVAALVIAFGALIVNLAVGNELKKKA